MCRPLSVHAEHFRNNNFAVILGGFADPSPSQPLSPERVKALPVFGREPSENPVFVGGTFGLAFRKTAERTVATEALRLNHFGWFVGEEQFRIRGTGKHIPPMGHLPLTGKRVEAPLSVPTSGVPKPSGGYGASAVSTNVLRGFSRCTSTVRLIKKGVTWEVAPRVTPSVVLPRP